MVASVIRLDTRRPVDPAALPAFAGFQQQLRAAAAAEQACALVVIADDLARLEALAAQADPKLAEQLLDVLSHAAGVIVPELDAAASHLRRARS
ncbi:hypothetical protein [Methylobacterium sp. WSM2598]|uniref:hypothetical protein n=1 Tax=Methylobacterium sp. WSM2598 TaxID=398261 RepID=UPI0003711A98|nr:hypothetical protein [Methylobacterium sp. WSM2598]